MNDQEKIELASKKLFQAALELEEAANIIRGQGLPSVADLFRIASKSTNEVAIKLLPDLVGSP